MPHTYLTLHTKQGLAYAFCNSNQQEHRIPGVLVPRCFMETFILCHHHHHHHLAAINAVLLAVVTLITRACCLQADRHRGPEPASLQAGRCVTAATRVAAETCWGAGQEVGAPAEAGGDCPASGCQKVCHSRMTRSTSILEETL